MSQSIYHTLQERRKRGQKSFAILVDPDKADRQTCLKLAEMATRAQADFFLIGGSLITSDRLEIVVGTFKEHSSIPTILFPGSNLHVTNSADALLFLSLISGRNPEYLIGQHVVAAPFLKKSSLEIIPTGYILVNCGNQTTVAYISNTTPVPYDKPEIAAATAVAGELLGLKLIYMDGGSGALKPISTATIAAVRKYVDAPIIIGGGIRTREQARATFKAGADVIVVGTAIEEKPELLLDICEETRLLNEELLTK